MDFVFPEWAKVKCAALLGAGLPAFNSILVNASTWLDVLIKVGQVGVATATILYILAKWNKTRRADAEPIVPPLVDDEVEEKIPSVITALPKPKNKDESKN